MNNERGIALPMALIVLMILSALMAAFAVLATSEPQIASNQVASAQARALAESGVERALWALTTGESNPGATGVLVLDANYNVPSPVPAPYAGATEVTLGVGSFKVSVTDGAQPNQKNVTAIGYVPNATSPVAIKKITLVLSRFKWINPLCGLCAGGESPPGLTTNVQVGGSATVNASTSAQAHGVAAGAYCAGVTPTSAVGSTGTVGTNGSPDLYAPTGGASTLPGTSFPSMQIMSDSDIATLKAAAKSTGHYYQGSQTWTSAPPNGLIFVDTVSGNPLTNSSPSGDIPVVDIHGNWGSGWSGWLIVAGTINISGQTTLTGLVYAQNDVNLNGTGNAHITGSVISTNRVDTSSTNIDTGDIGNAPLVYNCPAVRDGGGQINQSWFIMPGTYREISGS